MLKQLKHKKNILFRIVIIIAFLGCLSLYFHYVYKIKFYDNFNVSLFDKNGRCVSRIFDVYGISYLGDTLNLFIDKDKHIKHRHVYFSELKIKPNYYYTDTLFIKSSSKQENFKLDSFIIVNNNEVALLNNYKGINLFGKIKDIKPVRYISIILFFVLLALILVFVRSKETLSFFDTISKRNKLIFIIFIIVIIVIVLFLFFCKSDVKPIKRESDSYNTLSLDYYPKTILDGYQITIEDTLKTGLEFIFSLNNNFWFNKDALLKGVNSIDIDDGIIKDKEIVKACKFIVSKTYHKHPCKKIFDNEILQNPYLLLNSTGYGLCSDMTFSLCYILENMRYKTIVRDVKSFHTFPEVFNGQKWLMLDPDFGLIFQNYSGEIASLNELQNGKTLSNINLSDEKYIHNIINFVKPYPEELKDTYLMDSLVSYTTLIEKDLGSLYFKLPPSAKIKFPIYVDSINTYLFKLIIPGNYKGELKIPLLIHSIKNNTNTRTDSLLNNKELFNRFEVSGKNIEVYAHINPLLFMLEDYQHVRFIYSTTQSNYPKIEIRNRNTENDIFITVSYVSRIMSESKEKYLILSEKYLNDLNFDKISQSEFEKILALHYKNKDYPVYKMEILKNADFIWSNDFDKWRSKHENIAFLLMLIDYCNEEQFLLLLKYIDSFAGASKNT